ncbi:MAG: hypothetical protein IT210_15595 [Armatimonadetes bacterium]|nr:hypothetical protein [Armatimonadota bacterium]
MSVANFRTRSAIRLPGWAVLIAVAVFGLMPPGRGDGRVRQTAAPSINLTIEKGESLTGPLYVTRQGSRKKIADAALRAWGMPGGRAVAYSGSDGAGGYEGEGQSLYLYNLRTGKRKKLLSEYYMIEAIKAVRTRAGKTAILVAMEDGGLGGPHVGIVDASRGQVWRARLAKILRRRGDIATVGYYRPEAIGAAQEGKPLKPYKTRRYSLRSLLRKPVIHNKRSPE